MTELRPHHLLARPGDRLTLCGIDTRTKDALPYLVARFLPRHRRGHVRAGKTFAVCDECERGATESVAT